MTTYMGFEGEIFHGAAGGTAATRISNSRDITLGLDHEKGETTVRGDGTAPPIKTERVVTRVVSVEFEMTNKQGDTVLEALRTAAANGTAVALRLKDHASGKGPDADFTVTVSHGKPLKGEQTLRFTCTPTDSAGRSPSIYV